MPFRLYCILLFDSVVDSVRIQNHYNGTKDQTGGHLNSPVLSLWLPWSYFSRLLRSCIGTVGLFLLPRPHRIKRKERIRVCRFEKLTTSRGKKERDDDPKFYEKTIKFFK